ncbi:MAG: hypothetical protein Q9226_007622 [Calogaya cf. arnoldii]
MRLISVLPVLALALFHDVTAQSGTSNTTLQPIPTVPGLNASEVQAALAFERSSYANTSLYTLTPQTALSRILYQTKDLNGSLVPASAFILWPYSPRTHPDNSYPVVAWGHGTTGVFPECAPSHSKSLVYQFTAPFPLVLQGYVVVAPDYAGLGVSRNTAGKPIVHQLYANQAAANDLFYAVEAAQSAFSRLSKEFVVVGHSQGGGAAWAAAERQAKTPVKGYLGAVAAAPLLNFVQTLQLGAAILGPEVAFASVAPSIAVVARAITSVFPDFDVRSVLTPAGVERLRILEQLQGCNVVASALFTSTTVQITQPDILKNEYSKAYQNLVSAGGKEIAGPMLVLQGTTDTLVPVNITTQYVNLTSQSCPESAIEYIIYEGAEHIPSMYTSQRDWLGWIEDRFAGKNVTSGLKTTLKRSALPQTNYQADLNWFLDPVTEMFQAS